MRLRPKNVVESLLPLTTVHAIIGYGAFQFPPGRRHPRFSLFYAIVVSSIVYTGIGLTVQHYYNANPDNGFDRIPYLIIFPTLVVALISQIFTWLNEKRLANFVKQMTKVDETLQELGATFDYTGMMNLGIRKVVWWLLIAIGLNIADLSCLLDSIPFKELLIAIPILHYTVHINSLITVYFSMMVGLLELRFRKVNEVLERISNPGRQPIINHAWQSVGKKISSTTFTVATRKILRGAERRKNLIQIIKQVHLMLCTLSREIIRVFGVQLVLEMTSYFLMVVYIVPRIYGVATDPPEEWDTYQQWLRIFVHFCWCTAYFIKLIDVNQVCEATSAEAYRTVNIIHRMDDMNDDPEFPAEVQQFSLQIKQNRLVFSPTGLITFGWKFVLKFISTIALYLVFVVQVVEESYIDFDDEDFDDYYDDYEEMTSTPSI